MPEGLVLCFLFDEGSGSEVLDSSGNGNDGTLKEGPKWTNDGKFGSGLNFEGGSYVEVPDSDSLDLTEQVTIGFWIRPTLEGGAGWAGTEVQNVLQKGVDAQENYELLLCTNGAFTLAWVFESGRSDAATFTGPFKPGSVKTDTWQHIAVTYKPGAWILYLDGEVLGEVKEIESAVVPNDKPLWIGEDPSVAPPRSYTGTIDEVVVFNRSLTQEEIKEVMGGMAVMMPVSSLGKLAITWGRIKEE